MPSICHGGKKNTSSIPASEMDRFNSKLIIFFFFFIGVESALGSLWAKLWWVGQGPFPPVVQTFHWHVCAVRGRGWAVPVEDTWLLYKRLMALVVSLYPVELTVLCFGLCRRHPSFLPPSDSLSTFLSLLPSLSLCIKVYISNLFKNIICILFIFWICNMSFQV